QHATVEQAVSRKIERFDLYLRLLTRMHKADVAGSTPSPRSRDGCRQARSRAMTAPGSPRRAHCVDCELLHDPVFGSRERLQLGTLLGFDQILDETARLLLGLYKFIVDRAAELGNGEIRDGTPRTPQCHFRQRTVVRSQAVYITERPWEI